MTKKSIFKGALAVALTAAMLPGLASCKDDTSYDYDNAIHAFGPSPVLRGETIEIIGEGLSGISKVVFPVDVEVTEFESKDDNKVVVRVPQDVVPGKLHIILNGQDIETKSIITYKEPISIESVTVEREPVLAGDIVTVKGDYVYNIATAIVGKNKEALVEAKDFVSSSRHEVKFRVPAEAITGPITLSDGNSWDYTTREFKVQDAAFNAIDKKHYKFNEELQISGVNLQLVKSLIFPGEIEDTQFTLVNNGLIKTRIPAETCSGPITMVLFSQNRMLTDTFKVPTMQLDTVMPSKFVQVGDRLTAKGHHLELVRQILVKSADGDIAIDKSQFEVNKAGTQLKFTAPEGMSDGSVTLIQNNNISAASTVVMKKEGNIIWSGNVDLGDWSTNIEIVNSPTTPEKYDMWVPIADAINHQKGTVTINFEQKTSCDKDDCNWWQLELRYTKDWSTHLSAFEKNGISTIELEEGQTSLSFEIDDDDLAELYATDETSGWAISGVHLVIKSIEFLPAEGGAKRRR